MQLACLAGAGMPVHPLRGHQGCWHEQPVGLNSGPGLAPVCVDQGEHHSDNEVGMNACTGRFRETRDTGSVSVK